MIAGYTLWIKTSKVWKVDMSNLSTLEGGENWSWRLECQLQEKNTEN